MTIQRKLNVLNISILLLLTLILVIAGTLVINNILYQLNQRLMGLEISNHIKSIDAANQTLKSSGLDGMVEYVQNAQKETIESLKGYKFGNKGFLKIFSSNGEAVCGQEVQLDWAKLSENKDSSGVFEFRDRGESYFSVYTRYAPWQWTLLLSLIHIL